MYTNQVVYALLAGTFTGVRAAPELLRRDAVTISTDGSCSATVTCAGSAFGDCCSPYGYW